MYCSECGALLNDKAVVCPKCGVPVAGRSLDSSAHVSPFGCFTGCWHKYATFAGRARRREYWFFALFNWLIGFGIQIAAGCVGDPGITYILFCIASFLPAVSVMVRRLHDTGRSGWWWLILLLPFIGWLVFLVFMCSDSQRGANEYGPNPKGL